MQIKKQLINYNRGGVNNPAFIVIHETDNANKGANAQAHYRYFNGGNVGASCHYVVDDKEVIQLVEHNVQSWHNGKKYISTSQINNPECNNCNSIGIEICVNQDGDYNKARHNAIELVKYIMKELNISADKVIRHYDSCGKHCPRKMMDNNSLWDNFKAEIKENKIGNEYNKAIDVLSNKGIVSAPEIWKKETYTKDNVKSLIIKISSKI